MRWKSSWLTVWFVVVAQGMLFAAAPDVDTYARRIAPLVDPAKLATLAERAANPRVQKYVAHLAEARQAGVSPLAVVNRALILVGMKGEASKLTAAAMLRNLTIAERLGCLNPQGIDLMRRGNSPIIALGPYARDKLSVDHIIPRAVVPELDRGMANLELMPLRMNVRKNSNVGQRQVDLGRKLHQAGMLNTQRLQDLERHALVPR